VNKVLRLIGDAAGEGDTNRTMPQLAVALVHLLFQSLGEVELRVDFVIHVRGKLDNCLGEAEGERNKYVPKPFRPTSARKRPSTFLTIYQHVSSETRAHSSEGPAE